MTEKKNKITKIVKDKKINNKTLNDNSVKKNIDDKLKLTAKEIFNLLGKYIVSQEEARRGIAIAFVNRTRRMKIQDEIMRNEIIPKNILMAGPTGSGKTEIARRMALITDSPFLQVEMTKFTEVGYAGKDVDIIIKDIVEMTIKKERNEVREKLHKEILESIHNKIADALIDENKILIKKDILQKLRNGELNDETVELEVPEKYNRSLHSQNNMPQDFPAISMLIALDEAFIKNTKKSDKPKLKKIKISEAISILSSEAFDKKINEEEIIQNAIELVEKKGVIFLDEIDKIANKQNTGFIKGEVSREGVQRDLLPIIEGTNVYTKYGIVKTHHILFITAGAFHRCKTTDLMPELQGRLPVVINLKSLTEDDFVKILTTLENNLIEQQIALFAIDNIKLKFEDSAIRTIAQLSFELNNAIENIGARRLHAVLEKVVEDINFNDDIVGKTYIIDDIFVNNAVKLMFDKKVDLKKYTL